MMEILSDVSSKIICNNNGLIYVKSSFIPPTTTTTTTLIPIVDIYYGISTKTRVTESDILSTFFTASGNVGAVGGRQYNFLSGYSYKYWCIPDSINDGDKVINKIYNTTNLTVAYDSYYNYYQTDPTPVQSITYGKITINSVVYRIYRTVIKNSIFNEYYVYSF